MVNLEEKAVLHAQLMQRTVSNYNLGMIGYEKTQEIKNQLIKEEVDPVALKRYVNRVNSIFYHGGKL